MHDARARGSLALLLMVAACEGEPESELATCEVQTTQVRHAERICGVTASGLLLRHTDAMVLERVGPDGSLTELTRMAVDWPTWRCGTVAEDPETGMIFVTMPGPDASDPDVAVPDTLLRFAPDGELLGSEALEHEGVAVSIGSALVQDGSLWLAGGVNLDGGAQAVLERHAFDGTLEWRTLGYVGWNPMGEYHDRPFDGFGMMVGIGEGLVALVGAVWGIDSAQISMLVMRGDGSVAWTQLLTPDDYSGPSFRLAGGEVSVLVAEQRQQRFDYMADTSLPPLLRPARSVITNYWRSGSIIWRSEFEWPHIRELRNTEAVAVEHAVFNVVSGADVDDVEIRHVALARHDWTGEVDCTASLDDLGLYEARRLIALDDGRLLLIGRVDVGGREDEYPVLEDALTLLSVDAGPWPYTVIDP